MDSPTGADPGLPEQLASNVALELSGGVIAGANLVPDAESWRGEVAERLKRYRNRRAPRPPRYPSLFLPFDSALNRSRPLSEPDGAETSPLAAENIVLPSPSAVIGRDSAPAMTAGPEALVNVIEFPRSAAVPVSWTAELAEPLVDRPRIVEVPEVLPPPPALGGILIEPVARPERLTDAGLPRFSASIVQRLLAGLADGLILGSALAGFATIFLRLNAAQPPLPVLTAGLVIVALLLWSAYEFLFVVYTGATPGLRLLRLRLVKFDGSAVPRRLRRWRVLASFLSASSLGLGYLWSVLDENGLCWHDRITHTHIQSAKNGQ